MVLQAFPANALVVQELLTLDLVELVAPHLSLLRHLTMFNRALFVIWLLLTQDLDKDADELFEVDLT